MVTVRLHYFNGRHDTFTCTPVAASRIMDDFTRGLDNPHSFYVDVQRIETERSA